jgi:MFS family permease
MRKVAAASFVGAFLEWYDFNLYAVATPLVFAKLFFPASDPLTANLLAFVTFGVGFVFRPIGGIVFGHFGDRIGRKATLVATLLTIGLATFCMGLLPSYAAIGVGAPILLIALRVIQGFGLGGEFGGAATLIAENAPPGRRGFWGSLPQMGGPCGFLLGTALMALFTGVLPGSAFLAWGWRVPFLISIALMVAGLVIRLKILETPAFRQMTEQGARSGFPLGEVIRRYPKNLLLAIIARLAEGGSSQVFLVFVVAYLTTSVGISAGISVAGVALYNAVSIVIIPVFGTLADRVGLRRIYIIGLVILVLFVFPYFWLLDSKVSALILLAMGLAPFAQNVMASVEVPFLAELVGTKVRYSGLSVIYQASAIIAGFVPAFFTWLLGKSGGAAWPIAGIVVVVGLLAIWCVTRLTRLGQEEVTGYVPTAREDQ